MRPYLREMRAYDLIWSVKPDDIGGAVILNLHYLSLGDEAEIVEMRLECAFAGPALYNWDARRLGARVAN